MKNLYENYKTKLLRCAVYCVLLYIFVLVFNLLLSPLLSGGLAKSIGDITEFTGKKSGENFDNFNISYLLPPVLSLLVLLHMEFLPIFSLIGLAVSKQLALKLFLVEGASYPSTNTKIQTALCIGIFIAVGGFIDYGIFYFRCLNKILKEPNKESKDALDRVDEG